MAIPPRPVLCSRGIVKSKKLLSRAEDAIVMPTAWFMCAK